jgi:hypothetical protein
MSMQRHDLYNALVYTSLIVQLVVSALLILLAAVPQEHHIALAVLGAANGVIAGVLGLVRGQGLPGRLLQYADGLRKVRETIEWLEKELVAGKRPVSYREVVRLREMYQQIRGDEHRNRPDSWISGLSGHSASDNTGQGASH